jgi:cytochrome b561
MAALLVGQILLGRYAHALDRSPEKLNLMMWHKSIGISLLLLVSLRLAWTWINPLPAALPDTARWTRYASRISHAVLYVLMIAIPMSGWLMNSAKNIPFRLFRRVPWPDLIQPSTDLGQLFENWHRQLGNLFVAFLCIHIAAALWHHFFLRDATLRRMLGQRLKS